MLKDIFKNSGTTKTEPFELIFFQGRQKILQKDCCADSSDVSELLTC